MAKQSNPETSNQSTPTVQDRIADLEAEVRLYREKAERAEGWLSRISMEIEGRLINEPEEKQRLH